MNRTATIIASGTNLIVSGTNNSTFYINIPCNLLQGLSGSIQQTQNGVSYLVGSTHINVTSQSNGQIIFTTDLEPFDCYASYLTLSTTSSLLNERVLVVSGTSGLLLSDDSNNASLRINDDIVATVSGTRFVGDVIATTGLSGSLQQLATGESYLAGNQYTHISTASNGQILIGSDATDVNASYIVLSTTSSLNNERVLTVSGTSGLILNDNAINASLSINDNIVATVSGTRFTGNVIATTGLSGTLQKLSTGESYLVAGLGINVNSSTLGQVTITNQAPFDNNPSYLVLSTTSSLNNERVLTVSGTSGLLLNDIGSGNNASLSINNNIVATVSGTRFTGPVTASAGVEFEDRWDDLVGAIDQAAGVAALVYQQYRTAPLSLYHFDYSKDECVNMRFHMPHTWNKGEVRPHLHFIPMGSGSGNLRLTGYYTWSKSNTRIKIPDISGWTPFEVTYPITPDMQYEERVVWLFRSTPTGSVADHSANLMIQLCRPGSSDPNDTYHASNPTGNSKANIAVLFLDTHYRKYREGTYNESDIISMPPIISLTSTGSVDALIAPVTMSYDQPALLWQWNTTGVTPPVGSGWSYAPPTYFSASATGTYTHYIWAKNDLGLYSDPSSQTITYQTPDTTFGLYNVFTGALVGLWTPEDAILDGTGKVMSMPARIGPTVYAYATPSVVTSSIATGSITRTTLYNNQSTTIAALTSSILQNVRTTIAIATIHQLPFGDYRCISYKNTPDVVLLCGNNASSQMYVGTPQTVYVNGICTSSVNVATGTMLMLESAYNADLTSTGYHINGAANTSAPAGKNWLGHTGIHLALNGRPSPSQRAKAIDIIGTRYGYSEQEIFMMKCSSVFGSELISMGFAYDQQQTGSLALLKNRVGQNLTATGTDTAQYKLINGRPFISSTSSVGKGYASTTSTAGKYFFAVLNVPSLPWANSGYAIAAGGITAPALQCSSGNSTWVAGAAGFAHYRDNVSTKNVLTGTHVYTAYNAAASTTGIQVLGLGSSYPTFDLIGDVAIWGCCSSLPTTASIQAFHDIVNAHYRI